jgi:hypothetical protein
VRVCVVDVLFWSSRIHTHTHARTQLYVCRSLPSRHRFCP